jgi:glycosyltransferase involved in cell wall biosynthesis
MPSSVTRVLMLTGRADTGGGPEHLYQLGRHLPSAFQLFIAAPKEPPYWERYESLVGRARLFELPHRAFEWSVLRRLSRWCLSNEINVIHSHGRAAGAYSRLLPRVNDSVFIHTQHGSLQFTGAKDYAYWLAELALSRRTDHFIAVSSSEATQLRRALFVPNDVSTIANGVVLTEPAEKRRAPAPAPFRVVHVTRYVPQKNSGMVLDVLDALRDRGALDRFHVDMIGDGPQRVDLEAQARKRGLASHLTFHGAQPSISPFLARAFCFLSTSRWEGMPLAVLEAMGAGLPVVASNTAGNNDVVSGRVGRLFDLNAPSVAAAHLVELSSDGALWKTLSTAARDLIKERYSADRMARDTAALYQRIIGTRERARRQVPQANPIGQTTVDP